MSSRFPFFRFFAFVRPQLGLVIGAALTGIGKFTLPLVFPLAFKYIIDVLLASQPRIDAVNRVLDHYCIGLVKMVGVMPTASSKLAALSATLLALYLLQSLASYYRNLWAGIAGNRIIFDLQSRLFAHLQQLPHAFFDRTPAGSIVSRILNDVQQAQELVNSALIDVWMDGLSLLFVVAALIGMNWRLGLVALGIAPVWIVFMRCFAPRIKAASHRTQETLATISGEVHERIVGVTTIKSFGREEHEIRRFRDHSEQLYERTIHKVKLAAQQEMLIQLLTRSAPTIVVWIGALMIMRGTMTLGTMVAFFTYLGFLYLPLERFAQLSVVASASLAAIERIFEFLDIKPEVANHPLSHAFPVRRGSVQFDRVNFRYSAPKGQPGPRALADLDLHIPGGSKVALVGRSGAGKTTLANLIPRFYEASSGRILIDEKDVRHYTLRSLRDSVSLVAQDALLFNASVRDNLLYARADASEKMLWQALELANMRGFVEELPAGIDTIIGESGVKISGGQRQRIALARAFLKDSRIVILDEATSSIDSEAENLIHEAMERLIDGRTVILIAHRLRSAISADMIVVLDRGSIVEIGTHRELLGRNGTYARLFGEQVRSLASEPAERSTMHAL